MNKTTIAQQDKTATVLPPAQGILQRKCACGNQTVAVGECAECKKKKNSLQRKLTIGASNDPLEQEADRVADQVLAVPAHSLVNATPPRIQRFTGQANAGSVTAPDSVDRVLANFGRPLESALREDMEQRFGYDFSRVRVHSDATAEQSARDVNAQAYTVGQDIAFGAGRFAPGSYEGQRLIAHELTHVIQQAGAGSSAGNTLQRVPCGSQETCPAREAGEVARSRTEAGYLSPDVRLLGDRKLLIADFGVGLSTVKASTRRELLWYMRVLGDPAIRITIVGYSDCQGGEDINIDLRHQRSIEVLNLLPARLRPSAERYMAALTDCLVDNSIAENRALNRSVTLEWSPPSTPVPQPGERPLTTAEGEEVSIAVGGLPAERLYGSLIPQGLWWLNGGSPTFQGIYPTSEPINSGLGDGDFVYEITAGADKLTLLDGDAPVRRLAGRNIPSPTMRSVNKSRRRGDVTIRITHTPSGATSPHVYTTNVEVYAPHRLRYLGVDHSASGTQGYLSLHYLQLLDNFDRPLPYMDVNEDFTRGTLERGVSSEWRTAFDARAKGHSITLGNAVFTDQYTAAVTGGPAPSSMRPQPTAPHLGRPSILSGTFRHDWFAGSPSTGQGVHVSRHQAYLYDDHGEYAQLQSPP